ncbi:MAG: PorT family protein [Cyclobacteriaceae bacterium]|nr:PorT family protein [Cyclobacteriaceae bacterium]MCH8517940.1 PorT family protein [Cyclobacteriaceae bacterium]
MKLFITVISFLVLIANNVSAQLLIGPVAGFQMNSTIFDDDNSADVFSREFVPAFHFGAVLNHDIDGFFSLHFELKYAQRGRDIRAQGIDLERVVDNFEPNLFVNRFFYGARSRFHFIEVPALLRMSFGREPIKYHFSVGPNVSYWLGGSVKEYEIREDERLTARSRIHFNPSDEPGPVVGPTAQRLQFGLDFGIGTTFDTRAGEKVMIDLRYQWGHSFYSTRSAYDAGVPYEDLRSAHSIFSLSAAYLFEMSLFPEKRGKKVKTKTR